MADGDAAGADGKANAARGSEDVRTPARRQALVFDRILFVLLGTLIVASVGLASFTSYVHGRAGALRSAREALISPGLRSTQELVVSLSLEAETLVDLESGRRSALRGELARYASARRAATGTLDRITRRIGGDARAGYLDLAPRLERWERALAEARASGAGGGSGGDPARETEALSRSILLDATALQQTLYASLDRASTEIDRAEQVDWYLTLGLMMIALASSAFIAWLVRRTRHLAEISERRRIEAQAAITQRTLLLRGITHDVKNPLGAADGSAQLLEMGIGGDLSDAQRQTVERIRRGIRGALTIVSDLLELSRAEAEHVRVEHSWIEIGPILAELADDYRSQAAAAGLTLSTGIDADLPSLVTDGNRVRQIVGNLLSNAIKYTPSGGHVSLVADVRGEAGMRWLLIRVTDTGSGVAPAEQEKIFEEYYRAGTPGSRPAGTGVGLTISRRLARLLEGDLRVESEPGMGSTFTLALPVDRRTRDRRASSAV